LVFTTNLWDPVIDVIYIYDVYETNLCMQHQFT
jgi:hypothetical protein